MLTSKRKRWLSSILLGTAITIGVTSLGFAIPSDATYDGLREVCFWQSNLLISLIPSGPIVRYESDGTSVREGTPITLLLILLGMISGIPIYSTLCLVII